MSERARLKAVRVRAAGEAALDTLSRNPTFAAPTVRTEVFRYMLLKTDGWIMADGDMYDIIGKSLGAGVYRVTLQVRS